MQFEFDVFVSYAHVDNTAADELVLTFPPPRR